MSARFLHVLIATATTLLGLSGPAAAADPHDPLINCLISWQQQGVLVFTGEAHAPANHAAVSSLTLTCTVRMDSGETFTATSTNGTPVVAVLGTAVTNARPMELCESGSAQYVDGHIATVAERCASEPVTFDVGPLPETPQDEVRCVHHRASTVNAWAIEAVAVAGASVDVPISTSVSCTLRDAINETVTVSGTQVGGAAMASGVERTHVAPIVSKCYEMTVVYTSGPTSVSHCEYFG